MDIQLQTILDPDMLVCNEQDLYFHKNGNEICYDGYFNLFYIEKWKRYTRLEELKLELVVSGYQKLRLYHNRECIKEVKLDANVLKKQVIFFPIEKFNEGVFWFSVVESSTINSEVYKKGFFIGVCSELRNIKIGVDICTYQREEYVLKNLRTLHEKVLKNHELQVSQNLTLYLIDNGRTLKDNPIVQEYLRLEKARLYLISNKNAGGTGGFTRGMLEVLNSKKEQGFTHILLMDDDAMFLPDLFVRIYGFLCSIKDEWKDITLGGTMFREDKPYELFAAGETILKGKIVNDLIDLDARDFANVSGRRLTTTEYEKKYYSAWWCCCFSLNVVREDNLPIPLFIHQDDVEFGIRNIESGVVFLNGVTVWHKALDNLTIGSNLYYDIRNTMIQMTQHNETPSNICQYYFKNLSARLLKGTREQVCWTISSGKDFLKGPEWLWKQDSEQLNKNVQNPRKENLVKILYESMKICMRLFVQVKPVSLDYRNNMKRYITKRAWEKNLGL